MESVHAEITRISKAKSDIKNAIEDCGVDVPDTPETKIDTYANYIRDIPNNIFSNLNVDVIGGGDRFIRSIKQTNGKIEAGVGYIVSNTESGIVPQIINSNNYSIINPTDEWILTSVKGATPTWKRLPENAFSNGTDTTYTLSGGLDNNKYNITLIPSSGSTTGAEISCMGAATSSNAGTAGLVPAPAAGNQTFFLRGDGTWAIPINTTYSAMTLDEAKNGTNTTARTITAKVLHDKINTMIPTDMDWDNITNKPSSYNPSTHTHASLVTEGDNRNVATTPTDYSNNFVFRGLKTNSKIGIPTGNGTYSYLVGLKGWSDSSGGGTHELAFNDNGVFRRNSTTSANSWGDWTKLLDSANYINYTVDKEGTGATGTWNIDISGKAETATSATTAITAINLLDKPILANSGTTKITVTAGGKTSSAFTVPYATVAKNTQQLIVSDNITTITDDNTSNWGTKGTSVHFYGTSNQITDLPNQYGLLLNITNGGLEVHLLWLTQSKGNICHRSGNHSGWVSSWTTLFDSNNYKDYINPTNFPGLEKVGTVTKVSTGTGLTGGDITTSGTISLSLSGVSAGSYGPSSNVTGNNNSTISIPYITVDSYGRITSASNKTYTSKNYYPTAFAWTAGTTAGPTGSLTGVGMSTVTFAAIPSASSSASGIITTGAQTLTGVKTFTNLVVAESGVQIGSTSDIGWYFNSGSNRITAGVSSARGVNVGSLLISNAWADYTNIPTNGAYIKGTILTPSLIEVVNTSGNTDLGMKVKGSSNEIGFIIGSGNTNRGIYDYTNAKWILYCDSSKVRINTWSSFGSATKPVYFSTTGDPLACTYSLSASINSGSSGRIAYYSSSTSIDDYASSKGTSTKGIYLNAGVPTELSYSLNATINSGTANLLAFYSGSNTISSRSISTSASTLYILGVTAGSSLPYSATQSTSGVRILSGSTLYAYGGFYESSDERLKDFEHKININLSELASLKKHYFTWKDNNKTRQIGVSAQEIQKLYPEIVSEQEDGMLNVAYDKLSVIALAAIDKLYDENKKLKERLTILENKIK